MEGFKEFQGKDLDDAIGQACSYYDTLREKLEIDIVNDSKSGIFGIVGARKAKIKARRVQLRTAVDSILGRNRDAAPENVAPQPKAAGRAPKAEQGTEKAPRAESPRADNARGDTVRLENSRVSEQPRPAENSRAENGRAENGRTENGRTENGRAENSRADNGRPDNGRPENGRAQNGRSENTRPENTRPENSRKDDANGEARKPRPPRTPRPPAAPRAQESRAPEFSNDGNSILSGQVQGLVADLENDEEASFGPGNEIPAGYEGHSPSANGARDDRAPKPRRPRPPRTSAPRAEGAAPGSILAGTLDSEALNEDAISEGLPIVPFDQLDQDRLRAISLEAVGRLVAPIVGDVPLTVELGDNRVNVVLDCGDDSGLLIGREGQTLASLQYLASRLVSRGMEAAVRVQLDAGEYRLRQDEKLRDLALSLAERVRATGKSHSTRPLSSYHRRIVHMALQEEADVQTRSSGDGALKRVVIQKKRGN